MGRGGARCRRAAPPYCCGVCCCGGGPWHALSHTKPRRPGLHGHKQGKTAFSSKRAFKLTRVQDRAATVRAGSPAVPLRR